MKTLQEHVENYLEWCRTARRLSPHTIAAYRLDLLQFAALHSADAFDAGSVRDTCMRLAESSQLAATSVKRKIASVRAFLRYVDAGLPQQVFGNWKLAFRFPIRLPRALNRAQLYSLLRNARQHDQLSEVDRHVTALCISLMAATGLRVSELCAILLKDIRFETGAITVRGKGARERTIYVTDRPLLDVLARHAAHRGAGDFGDDVLFLNSCGRPLTPQCLRGRLRALGTGSRHVTPHMLRHTAATLLLEEGVDTRLVQRLLGHASIVTTQLYTHVSNTALRSALERADVLRGLAD